MKKIVLFYLIAVPVLAMLTFLTNVSDVYAQDPTRFQQEINTYGTMDQERMPAKGMIIFTGSSSVRLWKNMEKYFPGAGIINRGFGGSQMSDLVFYVNKLIIKYHPKKVFIYEGDNDINDGKTPGQIINDTKKLVKILHTQLPDVLIYFISPKPSISRWKLKDKYVKLNALLKSYCDRKPGIHFIDVWSPMLDKNGKLLPNLFLEDNLHMNEAGYQIWQRAIAPYL